MVWGNNERLPRERIVGQAGMAVDARAEEEQTVALIQETAQDSELAGPWRCCGCT